MDGREPGPTAKRLQAVAANAANIAWLSHQRLYAHSDLADEPNRAAHGLIDIQGLMPHEYSFYAMYRGSGMLFAIAFGMHDIRLRLPGQKGTRALREGGTELDAGGPDWITLDAFDAQIPIAVTRKRLRKHCRIAHVAAAGI